MYPVHTADLQLHKLYPPLTDCLCHIFSDDNDANGCGEDSQSSVFIILRISYFLPICLTPPVFVAFQPNDPAKNVKQMGCVLVCVLFFVCSMSDGLLSNLLLLSEAAVCVVPLRQYMEVYRKRNPTCYLFITLCYLLLNKSIGLDIFDCYNIFTAIYTWFSFDASICRTTPFNHQSQSAVSSQII